MKWERARGGRAKKLSTWCKSRSNAVQSVKHHRNIVLLDIVGIHVGALFSIGVSIGLVDFRFNQRLRCSPALNNMVHNNELQCMALHWICHWGMAITNQHSIFSNPKIAFHVVFFLLMRMQYFVMHTRDQSISILWTKTVLLLGMSLRSIWCVLCVDCVQYMCLISRIQSSKNMNQQHIIKTTLTTKILCDGSMATKCSPISYQWSMNSMCCIKNFGTRGIDKSAMRSSFWCLDCSKSN